MPATTEVIPNHTHSNIRDHEEPDPDQFWHLEESNIHLNNSA